MAHHLIKKTRTICGNHVDSKKVDFIDEIAINNVHCFIYVGCCQHSGLNPHYHILSLTGELIISINNIESENILHEENWSDLEESKSFLKLYLTRANKNMDIFSNGSFLQMMWNVNNPEMLLPVNHGNRQPVPVIQSDLVATIYTKVSHNKERGYIFILHNEDLPLFGKQYKVGNFFEGYPITNIAIS